MSSGGMPSRGHDLRERRLVSPARVCTESRSCAFRGVHPQLTAVGHAQPEDVHASWARAHALGEEAQADAHELAALPLLRLLTEQVLVAGDLHGLAQARG